MLEQFACTLSMVFLCGPVQGSLQVGPSEVGVCSLGQQQLNTLHITFRSIVKCGTTIAIQGVHLQEEIFRQTSNISHTLLGKQLLINDHSDVVGASPVGAAPTTSSFSTQHLASIYCTKTTAKQDEKHLSLGIWCVLYKRIYGTMNQLSGEYLCEENFLAVSKPMGWVS